MSHSQFPCAQCGADLEFAPGTTSLKCDYCAFDNPIPQSEEDIVELDFHAALEELGGQAESAEQIVTHCSGCGAESTLDPNIAACECPFCGAAVVTREGSVRQIKPKSLLPFKIDRNSAQKAFGNWLKGLWFAPSRVKRLTNNEGLQGMYIPYWTYDCRATTAYTGQRGEHYYETESFSGTDGKTQTRRVKKTRWHQADGVVWNEFDDVLVNASESLPRAYATNLEPWDLDQLVPYADEYQSGFRTEIYQISLDDGFGHAIRKMEPIIRRTIREDIGGDEQKITSMKSRHDGIRFKHILLPVWVSAYRHAGKTFRFLVNARTGEVQGERPWSWLKIATTIASMLAAAALAYMMFGEG